MTETDHSASVQALIHQRSAPMETAGVEAHLASVAEFEDRLREEPAALVDKDTEKLCPVNHSFGDGVYVREWNSPAHVITISKIHKVAHPFFLLEGSVRVLTEDGIVELTAPHHGITPAGTQRVLYTHTAVKWVTVHVTEFTEATDIDEIEKQIIAKDAEELNLSDAQLTLLMARRP